MLLLISSGMNVKASEERVSDAKLKNDYQEMLKNGTIDNNITSKQYIDFYRESEKMRDKMEKEGVDEGDLTVRAYKAGFNFQKGDFLVTNATSFKGIIGHAAIITGANSVLDAPGYAHPVTKNGKKVSLNTTRQQSISSFLKIYNKKSYHWIAVWRAKRKDVSLKAAKWADTHYYSSKGTAKQDKFPKYSLSYGLTSTNKVYCSKLVYQAYYYGSGSLNYVAPKAFAQLVDPYTLPHIFMGKYEPNKVKTYK